MNSVDLNQSDRDMRSGDSILGTKLDMDVKTLKTLNRQFCSTETVKANVAKKQKIIVKRVFTHDNRYFEISAAVVSTTTFALILAFIMQMLLYIIAFGTILLTMIVIYGIVVTIQEIWPKPAYPDSVIESVPDSVAVARPSIVPDGYEIAEFMAAVISAAIAKGFYYYPAIRAGNAIWVSPAPISKAEAQVTMMHNSPIFGIMAAANRFARGLCAGLGGTPRLDAPTPCSGYWPHYHARNFPNAHCWFI